MVARFQVRGHSSRQPFSTVGPGLPLHRFHYILLIRVVDDPVKIQGDRGVSSISHCVCLCGGGGVMGSEWHQGGGGWDDDSRGVGLGVSAWRLSPALALPPAPCPRLFFYILWK